ncbi:RecE family exodeoxyribonuclease [Franconibacter pulveris 1160]|uniref:RecE family exodeoxyribonuclease n=1 Tax=Franconibacter pulveris TaxID=435910 RepID=UPI00046637F1|nr:RecE family exodeoxyribonuclease [Franconibacter pulveris]
MEFFNLIKASQKSKKPNGVFWFSAKTAARAKLQAQVILEDAEIEVGRGHDYQLPVTTNFPVVDDLPEEGVIDFTWCDRYELMEDGRTWLPKAKQTKSTSIQEEHAALAAPEVSGLVESGTEAIIATEANTDAAGLLERPDYPYASSTGEPVKTSTLPLSTQIALFFRGSLFTVVPEEIADARRAEMDTDNTYLQNLMLAASNVEPLKHCYDHVRHTVIEAITEIWPVEGKAPALNSVLSFMQEMMDPAKDRGEVKAKWLKKYGKQPEMKRTDKGTNAGGNLLTDRGELDLTLDVIDLEIACALLPMDFDIYAVPGGVLRRAKEMIKQKESPWKEWSEILRNTPAILDNSRAAIFALVRQAAPDVHHYPVSHRTYVVNNLRSGDPAKPSAELLAAARHLPEAPQSDSIVSETSTTEDALAAEFTSEEAGKLLAAERGEFVPGISDPTAPNWVHDNTAQQQPQVSNLGGGVFSIEGLLGQPQPATDSQGLVKTEEGTSDVQMETSINGEVAGNAPVSEDESAVEAAAPADAVTADDGIAEAAAAFAGACQRFTAAIEEEQRQAAELVTEEPENSLTTMVTVEPEAVAPAAPAWPAYFEPGRYEGLPNNVYHAANGISSTMVKDARVSLMYFEARHVSKNIQKEQSKVLDMGNLVHALALQPEILAAEFSIEPEIPQGAFTTTATLRTFIDEYNNGLPVLLSAEDIKRFIEEYNASLPAPLPLGSSVEETGQSYMALPAEYQRIEADQKQTATAMKACIKEYNATLPAPLKTSGSRDALLEQLAIVNPDLVAQEAQKPAPLKVSGTKAEMMQAVKSVKPDAVFADELLDAWRENPEGKVLVTHQQMETALAIQKALHAHPTAGKLLLHPSCAVEVSYFGIDEETGLEIRVRPDLELDVNGVRIGADLKTISMWNIKQSALRARLHREIIERDYHLSAGMYMETAALDQFFWIFVNKDEGYHWIAIVEASPELVELGTLEYRATMRAIAHAFDTGVWPAPITDDYTDELTDFDMRRLEALRTA